MEETREQKQKRQALSLAKRASAKAGDAGVAHRSAVLFAHDAGASLREIAEASGMSHSTVKRIIERASLAD